MENCVRLSSPLSSIGMSRIGFLEDDVEKIIRRGRERIFRGEEKACSEEEG